MNYEEFDRICWKTQIQGQLPIRLRRSTLRRLFVEGLSVASATVETLKD